MSDPRPLPAADDLVARLRYDAALDPETSIPVYDLLYTEAADEIERLRAGTVPAVTRGDVAAALYRSEAAADYRLSTKQCNRLADAVMPLLVVEAPASKEDTDDGR